MQKSWTTTTVWSAGSGKPERRRERYADRLPVGSGSADQGVLRVCRASERKRGEAFCRSGGKDRECVHEERLIDEEKQGKFALLFMIVHT